MSPSASIRLEIDPDDAGRFKDEAAEWQHLAELGQVTEEEANAMIRHAAADVRVRIVTGDLDTKKRIGDFEPG